MKDLREKYGFAADMDEENLQEKLKETREHLKREIRKVRECSTGERDCSTGERVFYR